MATPPTKMEALALLEETFKSSIQIWIVSSTVVGVDSCLNDQCGLTFSNGPGVAGVCPTAAIAANDIATGRCRKEPMGLPR